MLLLCFFHRQNKNRFEPLGPVFCLLSPCMTKNHVIVSILKIKAQRRSTQCIQNSSFQVIIMRMSQFVPVCVSVSVCIFMPTSSRVRRSFVRNDSKSDMDFFCQAVAKNAPNYDVNYRYCMVRLPFDDLCQIFAGCARVIHRKIISFPFIN